MKDDILKLREQGLTYNEIVNKLGCSKSTVSYYCRKNGVSRYDNSFKNIDNLIFKMQNYYNEGHSIREVAKEFNVTVYSSKKNIVTRKKISFKNDNDRKQSKVKGVIYWRQRAKLKLIEYKGGKCIICGYNKCIKALEFHHINPLDKDFTISGKTVSLDRMKKEVDKCILICSNCHCEIHDNMININDYMNKMDV